MNGNQGFKPGSGLLIAGLVAGMLFFYSQNSLSVQTRRVSPDVSKLSENSSPSSTGVSQSTGGSAETTADSNSDKTGNAQAGMRSFEISDVDLSDEAPQTHLPEVEIRIGEGVYQVEVTSTPEQARKGLMYRTRLAKRHGMLFPFDPPRAVNFWMKNTRIPLDMVFLYRGTVVNVIRDVPPCKADPCPTYGSLYPVDNVVELPAGTTRKAGINPGARVVFRKPIPTGNDTVPTAIPAASPASDAVPGSLPVSMPANTNNPADVPTAAPAGEDVPTTLPATVPAKTMAPHRHNRKAPE